jgi:hypothetical protein
MGDWLHFGRNDSKKTFIPWIIRYRLAMQNINRHRKAKS